MEPYQVERIATVLAIMCMFLSTLYTFFAVLLFLCHASDESPKHVDEHRENGQIPQPLVSVKAADHNMESPGFITMENSS